MTESFEDAMVFARKVVNCQEQGSELDGEVGKWCDLHDNGNCEECTLHLIDRLQIAHGHEMEQLRRLRFREGYEAGQRSMDAEHYAVALRLKHLPLDEDSHGNLSQIARAIWHSDFGWTKGACEALRDELVRLLGGVHDEPAPIPASGCACDADCNCHNQQPQAVAYDVLGNERHKAITELRKVRTELDESVWTWIEDVAISIGAQDKQSDEYESMLPKITCRLIHLLGGDEPDLQESPNLANCDTENGGEVTITDELRKFKGHINAGLTPEMVLALRAEVNCIADRIDAQFTRICWQQEAVLQSTIDTMVDERDELQKELENTRAALNRAASRWAKSRERERELRERLDEYERRDTAESIVRDIHLGKVTDSQAVERIRALP